MNTSTEKEWVRKMTGPASSDSKEAEKKEHSACAGHCVGTVRKNRGRSFRDVAGMESLKTVIRESFINVLNNRDCAQAYGILPPSLMFYGPSGCGKTFFAEAVANEAGVNFIEVSPDDIGSKWLHGTQQKIAELFRRAEREAPTVIFFDEFDAMVPARTADDSHNQNNEVNQFLVNLNNASEKGVYVIAATNRPECIDKAVLRSGRIDEMIYIDMPDKKSRESLFRLSLSRLPVADDIDYERLAELTEGYNCSDISYIVKVASRKKFNETIAEEGKSYQLINQIALERSISQKSPSVTGKELRHYERLRAEFSPLDIGRKPVAIGFHQNVDECNPLNNTTLTI